MFKVGDKVKCVYDASVLGLDSREVYKVAHVENNICGQPCITVDRETERGRLYHQACFQLAKKTPRERAIELLLAVLDGDEVMVDNGEVVGGTTFVERAAKEIKSAISYIEYEKGYILKSELKDKRKEQQIKELENKIKASQDDMAYFKKKLLKLKSEYGG